MKTAVSLPDSLFRQAERLAARLKLSRSRLYAHALERYVAEHAGPSVTERLDKVYAASTDSSELDPVLAELQDDLLRSTES